MGPAARRCPAAGERDNSQFRIETVVAPEVAERIFDYLRADVAPKHKITSCMETVEVLRQDDFVESTSA